MCNQDALLHVENLSVSFRMYGDGLAQDSLQVISDLSITLNPGEILAVAGSSGSGKSLLAHAVMGLLPQNAVVTGDMRYKDTPLTPENQKKLRGAEMALIPQSITYLDPLMRVENQVRGTDKTPGALQKLKSVFKRLDLDERAERLYPFQLSGGMARRVLFSTAIVSGAELIIADEPTPGMHPGQAKEALQTLRELADEGKGVVLITHDIDLALEVADKVAVFYAGTTVEETDVADFIRGDTLRHPYSKALWRAMPQNGFEPLAGFQPYAKNLPPGCLFAPRCALKTPECDAQNPPMRHLREGYVRCIHAT